MKNEIELLKRYNLTKEEFEEISNSYFNKENKFDVNELLKSKKRINEFSVSLKLSILIFIIFLLCNIYIFFSSTIEIYLNWYGIFGYLINFLIFSLNLFLNKYKHRVRKETRIFFNLLCLIMLLDCCLSTYTFLNYLIMHNTKEYFFPLGIDLFFITKNGLELDFVLVYFEHYLSFGYLIYNIIRYFLRKKQLRTNKT